MFWGANRLWVVNCPWQASGAIVRKGILGGNVQGEFSGGENIEVGKCAGGCPTEASAECLDGRAQL